MKGHNIYLQCGTKMQDYVDLNKILLNGNITTIKCGGWHTIATVNNNEFYSFGNNDNNILLHGNDNNYSLPKLISNEYIMKLTKSNQKILDIIPTTENTYILQESI